MLENGMAFTTWMIPISLPRVTLISESTMTSKEKAQLYHCCLGHPSFRVI